MPHYEPFCAAKLTIFPHICKNYYKLYRNFLSLEISLKSPFENFIYIIGVVTCNNDESNLLNMKAIKTFLISLGVITLLSACSKNDQQQLAGKWVESAPQKVTDTIADAATTYKTLALEFKDADKDSGTVTLSADYDVTAPAEKSDSTAGKYTVKASINATWTRDKDDSDEYILAFDKNSLSVAGTNAPALGAITDNFLASLQSFTKIEDVKPSATTLTFETDHPEKTYTFTRK